MDWIRLASVLISWPIAVTVISLVFFSRFKGAIDQFLRDVKRVNFPGGAVERQPVGTSDDSRRAEGTTILSREQTEQLTQFIDKLTRDKHLANKTIEDCEKRVTEASITSYRWKFGYLNNFFVHNTKQVLLWFAYHSPQSRQAFHQAWQHLIPSVNERETIISVCIQYGVLRADGNNLNITQEGQAFLQYIGLIPSAPA